MHDQVTVHIKAPALKIWELIADVTSIGRFSPETFEAEWIPPSDNPAVGAWFRGHVNRNQRGVKYWTRCRVTECEPGRVFAFAVMTTGRPLNTWRYEMEENGDGTDVTESFRLLNTPLLRLYWFFAGRGPRSRLKTNREGMRSTLERVKAEVETC